MTARSTSGDDEDGTFVVYVKDGFVRVDAHYDGGSRFCYWLTAEQVRSFARELLEAADRIDGARR